MHAQQINKSLAACGRSSNRRTAVQGRYETACQAYRKALSYLNPESIGGQEDRLPDAELDQLRAEGAPCLLNRCCQLSCSYIVPTFGASLLQVQCIENLLARTYAKSPQPLHPQCPGTEQPGPVLCAPSAMSSGHEHAQMHSHQACHAHGAVRNAGMQACPPSLAF